MVSYKEAETHSEIYKYNWYNILNQIRDILDRTE